MLIKKVYWGLLHALQSSKKTFEKVSSHAHFSPDVGSVVLKTVATMFDHY